MCARFPFTSFEALVSSNFCSLSLLSTSFLRFPDLSLFLSYFFLIFCLFPSSTISLSRSFCGSHALYAPYVLFNCRSNFLLTMNEVAFGVSFRKMLTLKLRLHLFRPVWNWKKYVYFNWNGCVCGTFYSWCDFVCSASAAIAFGLLQPINMRDFVVRVRVKLLEITTFVRPR